jgi:hypothetical protein
MDEWWLTRGLGLKICQLLFEFECRILVEDQLGRELVRQLPQHLHLAIVHSHFSFFCGKLLKTIDTRE